MQKIVALGLLVVLAMPGTHAFSQVENVTKGVKNLAGVEAAITRATQQALHPLNQRALNMLQIRINGTYQQAWKQFYRGDMQIVPMATAVCKFYTLHPELLHTGLTKVVEKSTGRRFMVLEPVLRGSGKDVFLYSLDNTQLERVAIGRSQLLDEKKYKVIE